MSQIIVDDNVKRLSEEIASNALQKVKHYFPIDRFFLEEYGYLEEVKQVDPIQFIFCNLERVNPTYTDQLLLCLPELWESIDYENLVELMENFTNPFSFYVLIGFTYKYLEIDLLNELFLNPRVDDKLKTECLDYFPKIVATFYLDEDDHRVFDENLAGIHINDWNYTKQRLLVNKRVKPALEIQGLNERLKEFKSHHS